MFRHREKKLYTLLAKQVINSLHKVPLVFNSIRLTREREKERVYSEIKLRNRCARKKGSLDACVLLARPPPFCIIKLTN